jgi:predicted RNase H-like HicB family nuclease
MRYLVVVERGKSGFGAYVPDLPGCIAAGDSEDEVLALIREAIEFHIEGLREHGEQVPAPSSSSAEVEVGTV